MKRHMDMDLLDHIIRALSRGETLPERNKDHSLTGDWVGHRECHIQPDWLLVYRMEEDVLVLTLARTGTHSDLFGKSSDTAVWEAKHPVRRFCTPKGRGNRREIGGGFGGFSWRAHTVRLCSGFARLGKNLHHEPGAYAYASGDGRGGGWLRRQRASFWRRERDLMARSRRRAAERSGQSSWYTGTTGVRPQVYLGPPACVVGGQAAGEVIGDAGGRVPSRHWRM